MDRPLLGQLAYSAALKLLARRELSTAELRSRLAQRGIGEPDIEVAIERLLESQALDDARVARAYARTAAVVKGRGRVRVARELHAMGIASEVAAAAIREVFSDLDEHEAIGKAIAKKTRGRPVNSIREKARLHAFLIRQGFTSSAVTAALRGLNEPDAP